MVEFFPGWLRGEFTAPDILAVIVGLAEYFQTSVGFSHLAGCTEARAMMEG